MEIFFVCSQCEDGFACVGEGVTISKFSGFGFDVPGTVYLSFFKCVLLPLMKELAAGRFLVLV